MPTPLLVIMACCEVLTNESKKGKTESASVSLANSKNKKKNHQTQNTNNYFSGLHSPPFLRWGKLLLRAHLGNSSSTVCISERLHGDECFQNLSACMLEENKLSLFSAMEILAEYVNSLEQYILGNRNWLSPRRK